jgi:hypothetical protein
MRRFSTVENLSLHPIEQLEKAGKGFSAGSQYERHLKLAEGCLLACPSQRLHFAGIASTPAGKNLHGLFLPWKSRLGPPIAAWGNSWWFPPAAKGPCLLFMKACFSEPPFS